MAMFARYASNRRIWPLRIMSCVHVETAPCGIEIIKLEDPKIDERFLTGHS